MTPEDIDRGLRELGLADNCTRLSLSQLADLAPHQPAQLYETATAAHTATEISGARNAELEPGS